MGSYGCWALQIYNSFCFSAAFQACFVVKSAWLHSCLLYLCVERDTVSGGVYMYCFVVNYVTFLPLLLYLKHTENHPILQKNHSSWLKRLHTSLGLVDFCQLLQLSGQTVWRTSAACDSSQRRAFIGSLCVHSPHVEVSCWLPHEEVSAHFFKVHTSLWAHKDASILLTSWTLHTHTHTHAWQRNASGLGLSISSNKWPCE